MSLHRWKILIFLTVVFLTLPICVQSAETQPARLKVWGEVENPLELSLAEAQSLPRMKIETRDHDGATVSYEGVSLWEIIHRAKPRLGDQPNRTAARALLVVKAADDYQAVFAFAEFDPDFTGNQILLADQCGGKPLTAAQGPFQLVVPGDKLHSRWVRQVIELKIVLASAETKKTN